MPDTVSYTISKISTIINGRLTGADADHIITQLLTDSRKVLFPSTALFFALNGPRRSGTSFIGELYSREVRSFVISDPEFDTSQYPAAMFIHVDSVLNALQRLVAWHRGQFDLQVIGITGSNGKTIVKEWLYQLLQNDFNIARSPKSFNSQIGVPLSVWELNASHDLGIFEAGISRPGEMERLEKIIQPTIGIFTSLGEAHNEGFSSAKEKIREKLKLFSQAEGVLYCKDYDLLEEEITSFRHEINPAAEFFSWSRKEDATLRIIKTEKRSGYTVIHFDYAGNTEHVAIPFTDEASIENTITCICVLLSLNYEVDDISNRLQLLSPVEMRLQLRKGINGCSIIDDSYSADLNSLSIALDFLLQQKQHHKFTVIVSDILQSGRSGNELYRQMAAMLKEKEISRMIGVGVEISANEEEFVDIPESRFFISTADLKNNIQNLHFRDEAILLKGARMFEFEDISKVLQEKTHETVLEIDLTAMAHNLNEYKSVLKPGVKLMVMVKASGYGSGSNEIAGMLQYHKVDYLAVAYTDEGVELRKAGITIPIMVMNPEENTFDALTRYDLEPELFSFSIMAAFTDHLRRSALTYYPVHIKLDTGMHRLGFEPSDIDSLVDILSLHRELKIQSVFSHLAASDDPDEKDFTHQQAALFNDCCEKIRSVAGYDFIRHIANSSGISTFPELHMDMVRLGIGLYGVDANPAMQKRLMNVATLKTTIAQLKKVKAGDAVGYGRKARLQRDSLIATVRIGYADGYPRILGNGNGKMLISDRLAPVIGNVCMDMTMLDVTGLNDLSEGQEVLVYGNGLPVSQVARWADTISYEIMTGISERVKRVYLE